MATAAGSHPGLRMAGAYVPRSPTTGVLYGVVRTHLAHFLAAVPGLPFARVPPLSLDALRLDGAVKRPALDVARAEP